MQQRSFQFSTLEARTIDVNVMCHAPPEAVAHKTLTLRETPQHQQHQGAEHHAAPGGKPVKLPPQSAPDLIGLDIWPASIALCRYLAAHPYLVVGQHVLELGAGQCGVCCTTHMPHHMAGTWPWQQNDVLPVCLPACCLLQAWACLACSAPAWVRPQCC
jgi:predicted nicotinamide N-methyase